MDVAELRDPNDAYGAVLDYLVARPADHNLLHTILNQARELSLEGRFWIARDATEVVGFALQSPPGRRVVLGCMNEAAARALAEAVDGSVPGAQGGAAVASVFTGH